MRAILIDPFKTELTEVEIHGPSSEHLKQMYKLMDCEVVQQAYLTDSRINGVLLVDENGKLGIKPEQRYFEHTLFPHDYLAGKALWVGHTNYGWRGIGFSLEHAKTFVEFLPFKFIHI